MGFIVNHRAPTKAAPTGTYYLQLDIGNFFHSIDRRKLFEMLRHRIESDMRRPATDPRYAEAGCAQEMLHLARVLLTGNPALNADYRGDPANLKRVPQHKQLANAPHEKGLPIGNLTSQFFANVYLNELDQFVKHTLKVKHYVRYVDDFVLLHDDRAVLDAWRTAIIDFLRDRLGLTLRDNGRLAPVSNGIDFLGYIIRADYRLVRRRVVGHMKERMADHEKRILRGNGTLVSPPAASDAVQATLASYFGHFRHARSARLQDEVFVDFPWLAHILASPEDGRLKRVDRPGTVTSLVSQWSYFRHRYPHHVLLVQVGNCWECQGPKDEELPQVFRHLHSNRPGLPQTWTVAARMVPALKRLLTRRRQPWCEVCENGYLKGGMKRRQMAALWPTLPAPPAAAISSFAAKAAPTRAGGFVGGAVGGAVSILHERSEVANCLTLLSAPMGFIVNHRAIADKPAPTENGFVGGALAPIGFSPICPPTASPIQRNSP